MKRENSGDPEDVKRPKLTDDEELLKFQKEAILLQMKEYKRKYQTCCSTIQELNLKIEELQEENIMLSTARSDPEKEQRPENIKIVHLKEKVADLTARLENYTDEIDRLNKKIDRITLNKSKVDNMASSEQGFVDQSQITQERDKSAAGEASQEEIQDLKYQISLRDEDLAKAEKEISHLSLAMKQSQIDMKVLRQSLERQKEFERELKSMINEHELKVQNQQLSDQVQLLQQSRREYQQLVKDEEEKKRKILEADLKKNNQELTRLRANRDHLAKTVESLKSKTLDGELSHLKSLVEARKLKIDFLESELVRLKSCVAADLGEAGLLKFFDAGIDNPYKQLNSDLEVAKLKIKQLESGTTNDTNVKQIKMLQDVIARYTALYGELSENPLDSGSILEKTTAELDILKTKLSQKEKSEQRLMQELETLGSAWSTLEKQYTASTPALVENKNIAEKQKLEQKLLVYQKQNSSFNNTYKAQKSQFEKQLEQIRKLEEVEKNHLSQIQTMERMVADFQPTLRAETKKLEDIKLQFAEVSEQNQTLKSRCEHMHSVIEITQGQLDVAQSTIRTQQQTISSLQKKNSRLEQSGGTSELLEEIANYRQLTMCSACGNSFKTHLLMKCMHTFCHQCIDDMVQSRQRKCPSCGLSFGKEDIRQFYL